MFPCAFITLSTLNFVARTGFEEVSGVVDPHTTGLLWGGIVLVLTMLRIGNLSYSYVDLCDIDTLHTKLMSIFYSISMILTKEHSPNLASLGSSNGLVQFSMCLARAISPAFVRSVFPYTRAQAARANVILVQLGILALHRQQYIGRLFLVGRRRGNRPGWCVPILDDRSCQRRGALSFRVQHYPDFVFTRVTNDEYYIYSALLLYTPNVFSPYACLFSLLTHRRPYRSTITVDPSLLLAVC